MLTVPETAMSPSLPEEMTERTKQLREALFERACENRKDDWLDKGFLPDLSRPLPGQTELEPVIVRRARGIAAVLTALTDPEASSGANSYTIQPGELLVGVLPMGSNGLGKVFPDYLNEAERHMASIASRSEMSVQGHNAADFRKLVECGIRWILEFCGKRIAELGNSPLTGPDEDQRNFYQAVSICCQATVDYARRYAELAADLARKERDKQRKEELLEIERICRKVPLEPAETFREALQSILFLQIALRAGMDLTSMGRLDQTLQGCLERTLQQDPDNGYTRAVELAECFVIKTAGPLNLTVEHLIDQDHIDYGISMGTHKWYVDQRGNVNQFLQNVVIGGHNEHGGDDSCDATYVLLQAWVNVNLPTPGLYVRLHENSPQPLLARVASAIARTRNLPSILNDDVIIPGLRASLMADGTICLPDANRLAHDYCVDGCWEPILNGQSDWTFQMLNGMLVLECALNEGATLDANPMYLRGDKRCFRTPPVTSYEDLKKSLLSCMDFFVSQASVATFNYYLLDEYVTPAPLLSAFLGACLERGRDKTWGGTRYALVGTVLSGLPNMVNQIAAIKRWVFDEKKYTMAEVLEAIRNNFGILPDGTCASPRNPRYSQIWKDFSSESPKYGNNDLETNGIARFVADCFLKAVEKAKALADDVYRTRHRSKKEAQRAHQLRFAGGYYGPMLEDRLSDRVTVAFTAGLGTFATYVLMGQGAAASADRLKGAPLAMNNTPAPGTIHSGVGHTLKTLNAIGLERFAAGAPVDLCLEVESPAPPEKLILGILNSFVENGGNVLSLTLGKASQYKTIYDLAVKSSTGDTAASRELLNWGHVTVRAGGWQTPFITMSLAQQKHYTMAPVVPD
jgi:pyruvate-formate lyase